MGRGSTRRLTVGRAQTLFSTVTNAWQTSRRTGCGRGRRRRNRWRVGGWRRRQRRRLPSGGGSWRSVRRPRPRPTTAGATAGPGETLNSLHGGGRATSIDSSAPETKARGPPRRTLHRRCRRRRCYHPTRSLTFHPLFPASENSRALPLAKVEAGVEASATYGDDADARETSRRDDATWQLVRVIGIIRVGIHHQICSTRKVRGSNNAIVNAAYF